jgi:mRNA interferase YafQ
VRKIIQSKQFKKDYKKVAVSGRYFISDFLTLVKLLAQDAPLPEKYRDHALKGEWIDCRECHIKPDWLLVYEKINSDKKLILVRTGTHSELFS